jgi:hypothetical protein
MPSTVSQLITRTRRYLRELNPNTSWWSEVFLLDMLNASYRLRNSQLIMADEGYYSFRAYTPVISNRAFYDWPNGFNRMLRLDLEVTATGASVPIQRWARRFDATESSMHLTSIFLPTYRPVGGGFIIEPAFKDGIDSPGLLDGFEDDISNYVASTDCVTSLNSTNVKQGSYSLQIDRTATTQDPAVVWAQRTTLSHNLSNATTIEAQVYIPSLSLIHSATSGVFLRIGSSGGGTDYNEYWVPKADLLDGWNTVTFVLGSPDVVGGAIDMGAVDFVRVGFGLTTSNRLGYGFLVDSLVAGPISTTSPYNLIIEYNGVPEDLVDDNQTLHPDFPSLFEELIVYDTVVTAMNAESMVENGVVRAINRSRLEYEAAFMKFIDMRTVSVQNVEPDRGHYADA